MDSNRQKSILLVEDDKLQALIFIHKCKCFSQCFIVHETDGEKALRRLTMGEKFDIIVSDVHMPHMDGITFFNTMFLNNLNEQADANIIVTSTVDVEVHKTLSIMAKNFNILVYDKNLINFDFVRDVMKPLIDSVSVDDARMVIDRAKMSQFMTIRASLLDESSNSTVKYLLESVSSGESVASIGEALVSTCIDDSGQRVRAFYNIVRD